jgi:hypothetical protein
MQQLHAKYQPPKNNQLHIQKYLEEYTQFRKQKNIMMLTGNGNSGSENSKDI